MRKLWCKYQRNNIFQISFYLFWTDKIKSSVDGISDDNALGVMIWCWLTDYMSSVWCSLIKDGSLWISFWEVLLFSHVNVFARSVGRKELFLPIGCFLGPSIFCSIVDILFLGVSGRSLGIGNPNSRLKIQNKRHRCHGGAMNWLNSFLSFLVSFRYWYRSCHKNLGRSVSYRWLFFLWFWCTSFWWR